jgi:hypothetical protein
MAYNDKQPWMNEALITEKITIAIVLIVFFKLEYNILKSILCIEIFGVKKLGKEKKT